LSQPVDGFGGFDQLTDGRRAPSCQIAHHPVEGEVKIYAEMGLRNGKRNFKSVEFKIPWNASRCRPFSMSLSKKMALSALSTIEICSIVLGGLSG
jgi:hypothetical protein